MLLRGSWKRYRRIVNTSPGSLEGKSDGAANSRDQRQAGIRQNVLGSCLFPSLVDINRPVCDPCHVPHFPHATVLLSESLQMHCILLVCVYNTRRWFELEKAMSIETHADLWQLKRVSKSVVSFANHTEQVS